MDRNFCEIIFEMSNNPVLTEDQARQINEALRQPAYPVTVHRPTDLERFVALYASVGIACKVSVSDKDDYNRQREKPVQIIRIGNWESYDVDEDRDTKSDKFDGYGGFYSEIIFDMDGNFIKQCFWE